MSATSFDEVSGLAVECCEDVPAAQSPAFECNHAVGKVTIGVLPCKTGQNCGAIEPHFRISNDFANGPRDRATRLIVGLLKNPDKFAQRRQADGDLVCIPTPRCFSNSLRSVT